MKSPLALNWCIIWCSGCQVIWMSPYNKIIYLLTDYKPSVSSKNFTREAAAWTNEKQRTHKKKLAVWSRKMYCSHNFRVELNVYFKWMWAVCEWLGNYVGIHGNRNESFRVDKIFHIFNAISTKTQSVHEVLQSASTKKTLNWEKGSLLQIAGKRKEQSVE